MANCCNQCNPCGGSNSYYGTAAASNSCGCGSPAYFGGANAAYSGCGCNGGCGGSCNGTAASYAGAGYAAANSGCGCGAARNSRGCNSRCNCCGCNGGCGICCCTGEQGPAGPRGPQGIAGPQGPAGPAGTTPAGLAAYGGLYNSASQTPAFTAAGTYVPLTLNTAMPSANVTSGANSLTIAQSGDYEVFYNILMSTSAAVDVAAAVRRNGAEIVQTRAAQTMAIDDTTNITYDGRLTGSTILALAAGDVLDLAVQVLNTLPAGLSAAISGNANAVLTVKKLNAPAIV